MSTPIVCECGRAVAKREVYCSACGRKVPGRVFAATDPGTDAAPPGWLVAADARGESGWFEPMPAVPVSVPDWQEQARPRRVERAAHAGSSPVAMPPPVTPARLAPSPPSLAGAVDGGGAGVAVPPLHALQAPLLALVVLSTAGAVLLLVLHVLLGR